MSPFAQELVAICRVFGVFEREAVCCGTVTVPQCVALQALLEGDLDVASVAERMGVTPSAATRLVDGLEGNSWVERRRDPNDRRRIEVTLTPAGKKEAERLRDLTEQATEAILSAVPAGKRAQVTESVRLLREAVEKARGAITDCCGTPCGGG
ncbi:MAG: winged helix-turn-helix transcriptional regulator [Myxococcales bacterium]|nr:winged helix-turn-helix transcriptional regulator [Myxococcales bacterium]